MADLVQQNLSRLTDTRNGLTRTLNYGDGSAPLWRTWDAKAQKSGKLHTVYWPDGDQFTGEWFDNKRDGYGIQKYKNGSKYEGEWKSGLRSGKGTFFSRVEGKLHKVYDGTWRDDKMEGLGTYFFPNGDIYEGEFKSGFRHGWGVHVNKAGDKYEGEWAEDKKSGFGTLTMANQNRYEGKWLDDKKHGPGVFYYMSRGQRYDGEWVNDTPKCGSLSEMQTALTTNPATPLPKLTLMNPEEVLKSQTELIRKTAA